MNEVTKGTILEKAVELAPIIQQLTLNDICVTVSDTHKYLCYHPGKKINHHAKAGDEVKHGSIMYRAMRERRQVVDRVNDKSLFGITYIGVAVPLYSDDGRQVIGSAFIGESTEKQDRLNEMMAELSASVKEVNENTQKASQEAESLAALGRQLSGFIQTFETHIKNIDEVMRFIKDVAAQTNMLGLNAAIEAARVGVAGLGFGVVANEIRKLSAKSSESAETISKILEKIRQLSLEIAGGGKELEKYTGSQSQSLQNIAAAVEVIDSMVDELAREAEIISSKTL